MATGNHLYQDYNDDTPLGRRGIYATNAMANAQNISDEYMTSGTRGIYATEAMAYVHQIMGKTEALRTQIERHVDEGTTLSPPLKQILRDLDKLEEIAVRQFAIHPH